MMTNENAVLRSGRTLVAILFGSLILFSCSPKEQAATTNTVPTETVAEADAKAAASINACSYLTPQEIGQILGETVEPVAGFPKNLVSQGGQVVISRCEYNATASGRLISLNIARSALGRHPSSLEDYVALMQSGSDETADAAVDVGKAEAIPAVGDLAVWNPAQGGLIVYQNDYKLMVLIGSPSAGTQDADKEPAKELAARIVKKLS